MDILVVAQYFGDPEHLDKSNNRFVYLSTLLAKKHNVEVLTTSFVHVKKKQGTNIPTNFKGCKITALSEPGYKKNISIKRFYSHWILANHMRQYLKKRKKPDVIYCAVPSLECAYVVTKYAQKNNIRLIIDIQDLWPEAFKMVLRIPVISDIIFYPMSKKADYIYSNANYIVGVSDTYCKRAYKVNTSNNFSSVYLGTNFDVFDENTRQYKLDRNDKSFVLGYCGTLGNSYDLRCVFDALNIIKNKGYESIEFWIMGDGPLKQSFQEYAEKLNLKVNFMGRLPYYEMCGVLSSCDACINPINKGSAASIINKHADYAAVGIPVINTQESEEYRQLIDKYNCGINCKCGDALEVANAIVELHDNVQMRKKMGKNHRIMGEQLFDRKISYSKIIEIING